ncbi:MAG: hypothetical protein J6B64_01495 [Bacilli bacterium]|nr:hypothetical protein [Bacilli bacterium]MBP3920772.1 hypothetical protein [Bacilli bacterium]
MKKIIKKYWTHILSLGFLIYSIILFVLIDKGLFENINVQTIIILFGALILFVIGVWVEIIYHIVHAIKHKEIKNNALCAVLSYFLNVIYIPCYSSKHINKDENYKKKNIIYLILSILLYIILIIIMVKFQLNVIMYETYTSQDNVVNFKLPYEYNYVNLGEYDLYFKNDYSNIGIFIYDGYDFTDEDILNYQEQQIINTRENMTLINSKEKTIKNKTIKTHIYEGIYNELENIYNFSVITFDEKPNYIIYVIETTLKKDYDTNKNKLEDILKNINLNK